MNGKHQKLKKILRVSADVLFTVILICAVAAAFSVFLLRGDGGLSAKFGVVRSPSMEASGIEVGDVVYIQREDAYDVGDTIVFWRAPSAYGKPFDASAVSGSQVWVHDVIAVSTDALGRSTYLTKGTSNATDDGFYVPQDFVLGGARPLPSFLSDFMAYASTRQGIIVLVNIPCAILLVYLVWDLIMAITSPKDPPKQYRKSFTARLCMAEDGARARYNQLKNQLLGYKKAASRVSWHCESFRVGRKAFAKCNVCGKVLTVWFALPASAVSERKYGIRDKSAVSKYRDFPSMMKVRSDRALKWAAELVVRTADFNGFTKIQKEEQNYLPPRMSKRKLLKAGYMKYIGRVQVAVVGSAPQKSGGEVLTNTAVLGSAQTAYDFDAYGKVAASDVLADFEEEAFFDDDIDCDVDVIDDETCDEVADGKTADGMSDVIDGEVDNEQQI